MGSSTAPLPSLRDQPETNISSARESAARGDYGVLALQIDGTSDSSVNTGAMTLPAAVE